MSPELQKIKDKLKKSTSSVEQSAEPQESLLETMIRFLSDTLKFKMITISSGFFLISLSSKMLTKSETMICSVNEEILCEILIDAAISRTNRTKRDKTEDLIYLTTKSQRDVHVYEEHGKLINRAEIL